MKSAFLKIKVWQNWANYDQILGQSLATKLNLSKFKNLNSLKVHEYQVLSKKVKNCDLYTFYNPLKLKVNSVHCVQEGHLLIESRKCLKSVDCSIPKCV